MGWKGNSACIVRAVSRPRQHQRTEGANVCSWQRAGISFVSASSEKMLGSNTLLNKLRAVGSTRFGEPLSSSATSSILLLIEDGADPRIAISFPSCRVWHFTQQIKPTKEFWKTCSLLWRGGEWMCMGHLETAKQFPCCISLNPYGPPSWKKLRLSYSTLPIRKF